MTALTNELHQTAQSLVAPGQGILAADESFPTIGKRFKPLGVENSEPNRRSYRDMLFTTPGAEQFISGVILFDETLRQASTDGMPFAKLLSDKGILPGIKVDKGTVPMIGSPHELMTQGLDGLPERLREYRELGARFAKWRAVIKVGEHIPTSACLRENARSLALYAAMCQAEGIVPIVEPEVLMDGTHTIERCFQVTQLALHTVFDELWNNCVILEGMLLKPNMVVSGKDCSRQAGVDEVASETVRCLRRTVPAALPGIVFLSGGQSDELATAHLNAMNAADPHLPWQLSFSYGRALQVPALKAWQGSDVAAGQKALLHRARMNSAARDGSYTPAMERELVNA